MRRTPLYIAFSLVLGLLLTVTDGRLSLNINNVPLYVFPCKVATLPPDDQELLHHGIQIESIKHLTQRLEDYLS